MKSRNFTSFSKGKNSFKTFLARTTTERKRNITLWKQLKDLDFADGMALLSYTHTKTQYKSSSLEEDAIKLGLHINVNYD